MNIDPTDRRILALLGAKGRLTFQELGSAVGLSGPAVFQRVRKLEEAGVITGYHARVDPASTERTLTVFYRVIPGTDTDLGRLESDWRATPDLVECHRIGGEGAFQLKAHVADLTRVAEQIDAIRKTGSDVSAEVALGTLFERGPSALL